MKEQITDFVETRVENYEEELNQPLTDRLLKTAIVGAVGVLATAIAGSIYDSVKNRKTEETEES